MLAAARAFSRANPARFTIVDDLCADSLGHGISPQGVPAPCKFMKTQRGGKLDRRGQAYFL
jgi:hypothetical protein